MRAPDLSIVIPAYNEAARVGATLARIADFFSARGTVFEIIVVDDGSTDQTVSIATEAAEKLQPEKGRVRLLKNDENKGKGFSVRRGMLEARGRWALLTDADLSSPIEEYPKLEQSLATGPFQIAIGSRDIEGSKVEVHQSGLRENSGKLYNVMVRILLGLPFRDTQCGFKLFEMQSCREVFVRQTIEKFGFDVELLVIARKLGLRVDEVAVVWRHDEGSKVNFFRDGAKMVLDLLRIRLNALAGKYDRKRAHRN